MIIEPWTDVTRNANDVVAIQGEPGSGKTYLINRLIWHIKAKYRRTTAGKQVLTAYCHLDQNEVDLVKLISVFKAVIWQFTEQSPEYADIVSRICSTTADFNDLNDLLEKLLFEAVNPEETFVFIFIDGFHTLSTKAEIAMLDITQQILQRSYLGDTDAKRSWVRLCLSGERAALEALQTEPVRRTRLPAHRTGRRSRSQQTTESILDIVLGATVIVSTSRARRNSRQKAHERALINESDLRLFVQDRLHKNFQGRPEHRESIESTLIKDGIADFNTLDDILGEVVSCRHFNDVETVLQRSASDRFTMMHTRLAKVTEDLSRSEISELNALIAWLVGCGEAELGVNLLEQALAVCSEGASFGSLEDQVRHRYGDLLCLARPKTRTRVRRTHMVSFRSAMMRKYLSTDKSQAEGGSVVQSHGSNGFSHDELLR